MRRFKLLLVTMFAGLLGTCCAHTTYSVVTRPDVDVSIRHVPDKKAVVGEIDFHDTVDERSIAIALRGMETFKKRGVNSILVDIDTPGGNVAEGKKLAIALETYHAPVTCVVTGKAMSMGFYLLQSCDLRLATKDAQLMAHEPYTLLTGFGLPVNRKWLLSQMADHDKGVDEFVPHMARKMKKSEKEIRAKILTEDWNMTSEQGVAEGALDGVCIGTADVRHSLLNDERTYFWVKDSYSGE